ncbi:M90 family metallopeptidase [Rubrivirga sp.]|uniref:M90 family metallopeptidase n=1 Tax=Rubrivirga sp. TaxID=1885344 RepID=UPI003B517188
MRAVRSSDLVVPALGGALLALLAGLVVGRGSGTGAAVVAGAVVWAAVVAWALRRPLRRMRVARRPLPEPARAWLADHVRLYGGLDRAGRRRFERDVAFALDGLTFEGAGGAEPTDTLCLSVAAGAALLLHGHPDWELPTERTVLFVPDTFDEAYGDEEPGVYDGMVHSQGPIVLSTRAVEEGWAYEDGHNVVLHELAHVFDFDGWEADGVPAFLDPRSADAWVGLMRKEMRRAQRGDGILRSYAASAPAELFAVATEQFFERPARLRRHHAELFDALVAFYNLTPPDEPELDAGDSLMARRWRGEA